MNQQYPLNLANGQQTFLIAGAPGTNQQVVLTCDTYPGSGTATLESRLMGSNVWSPVPGGVNLPLQGPQVIFNYGAVAQYRLTLAGISGGSGLSAWWSDLQGLSFPQGAFSGTRALTAQSYTEANVKNGVQFEASALVAALAAGATVDTIFITGLKPVIVKARQLAFDGKGLTARVYRGPTYTGGTPVPIYNLNEINPVASTVQALSGAAVSAAGVEFGAPTFAIGSDLQGQSVQGAYSVAGQERLLAPSTTYLLRLTSTDPTDAQRVSTYLTWYEGRPDLPL
jgi:hypothetical protein